MSELTLHAMDETLTAALRRRAAETGASLNQAAKSLLAAALGVSAEKERPAPGFMRFAGGLSAKDAAEMRAALDSADFSCVDERDWR